MAELRASGDDRHRVVMLSGGAGSWAAARRSIESHGAGRTSFLFADTLIEDDDLYRFLVESSACLLGAERPAELIEATVAIPPLEQTERRRGYLAELAAAAEAVIAGLVWIADGRDPHQVYADVRFLGNSRVDPCSAILKRRLMRRRLERDHDPASTVCVLGFDWSEVHRLERAAGFWSPWEIEAPLTEKPYLGKDEVLEAMREAGIEPPRLYKEGFSHNNCGGFCCKAGQASFALLLRRHPGRYRHHERREEEFRRRIGRDVSILRDRRGGHTRPLTMREFRRRLERDPAAFDRREWGACSCMEESS